jgi:hypothetical protein
MTLKTEAKEQILSTYDQIKRLSKGSLQNISLSQESEIQGLLDQFYQNMR